MIYYKNDKFFIKGFHENCPNHFKNKIQAMGIIEGEEIIVVNISMFSGPIAFETNCGIFSLRKKDLDLLKLERIN